MRRSRRYLPATESALAVLGGQVAVARREIGWTAGELAERLGVTPALVARIERGAPTTSIGTVFEAAVLCGVPLFGVDATELGDLAQRQRDRVALLPARVRSSAKPVANDF